MRNDLPQLNGSIPVIEKNGTMTQQYRDYLNRLQSNLNVLAGTKAFSTATGNYTLTVFDYLIEYTAGSYTVTLPTAVGIPGREYEVKNSGTGEITVTGSETIDDYATQILGQYDAMKVMSNGSKWIII